MTQTFDQNAAPNWAVDPYYQFETVAASQTDQMLGSTGAIGDYLKKIIIIPTDLNPGAVSIEHASTNITIFAGGTASISELRPIEINLGIRSTLGGWEVTTGAAISVIAVGTFT
jgi:hypothetical protein